MSYFRENSIITTQITFGFQLNSRAQLLWKLGAAHPMDVRGQARGGCTLRAAKGTATEAFRGSWQSHGCPWEAVTPRHR